MTLDCGKGSYDPDGEDGDLFFSWSCVGPNAGGSCLTSSKQPLTFVTNSSVQARGFARRQHLLFARDDIGCDVW